MLLVTELGLIAVVAAIGLTSFIAVIGRNKVGQALVAIHALVAGHEALNIGRPTPRSERK
jgi:hypothetical protein